MSYVKRWNPWPQYFQIPKVTRVGMLMVMSMGLNQPFQVSNLTSPKSLRGENLYRATKMKYRISSTLIVSLWILAE